MNFFELWSSWSYGIFGEKVEINGTGAFVGVVGFPVTDILLYDL